MSQSSGGPKVGAAFQGESSSSRALRDSMGVEISRNELRRAAALGSCIWPAFTLTDLFMAEFLYPQTPYWHFLSMRLFDGAIFLGVYGMARHAGVSLKWVRLGWLIALQLCAVFISIMALDFGALHSAYMHGLSVAMLVMAIVVPMRWQQAIPRFAAIVAMFPMVMGIAALFSEPVRAQWTDRHSLLTFCSQYVFVLSMALVGMISSHLVWAAQRQVYQARKLGRYRLEVQIGQGGMNQVWLAWDASLKRQVALKLLQTDGHQDPSTVQRFEREALAASKLTDPHTIRIFDFGASDDGVYYIAMEYLRGADLAALVDRHGAMSPARVVHFTLQTCRSLTEAHDAGIIHRDVKPHNLFVTQVGDEYDSLKLLDFGIARSQVEADAKLTQTGKFAGTPTFMSPEAGRCQHIDARSDIYSVGATMYFLLAGSPPFVGSSITEVLTALMLDTPERPSVRRGEAIPEALEQIVLRCLEKDPARRFQTMRELTTALSQLSIGTWSNDDARRFWQVERPAALGTREAPGTNKTLDTIKSPG